MLRAIERKPVASLVEIGNNTLPVCGRVAFDSRGLRRGESSSAMLVVVSWSCLDQVVAAVAASNLWVGSS